MQKKKKFVRTILLIEEYQGPGVESLPGSVVARRPGRRDERVVIFFAPDREQSDGVGDSRGVENARPGRCRCTACSHIGGAVRGRLSAAQHRRVGVTLVYVTRLLQTHVQTRTHI